MHNQGEDIPDEDTKAGENLDFTQAELWAELDKTYLRQYSRPGDLTIHDLISKYGGGYNTWQARLRMHDVPPGFESLEAWHNGRKKWVLRKKA